MTSSKRVTGNPVKGWYYAAKYNGSNGDLVLGRVRSVRTEGEVILTNLLTGNRAVKGTEVLLKRNHKITKKESDTIMAVYNKMKDKTKARAKAREMSVALWEGKKNPSAPRGKDPAAIAEKKSRCRKLILQIAKLSAELKEENKQLMRLEGSGR